MKYLIINDFFMVSNDLWTDTDSRLGEIMIRMILMIVMFYNNT